MPQRSAFWIFGALFAIAAVIESSGLFAHAQYAKYVLPAFGLVALAALSRKDVARSEAHRPYLGRFLKLYLVLILASLVVHVSLGTLNLRFWEEAFFITAPLVYALCAFEFFDPAGRRQHARLVFAAIACGYVLQAQGGIIEVAFNPGLFLEGLRTSNMPTETGNYAYMLGFFFVYFHFVGDRRYRWVALVLTILAFKRLEFLSIIVVFVTKWVAELLPPRLDRLKWTVPYLGLGVNAVYIGLIVVLLTGAFDQFVAGLFHMNVDQLTMGRASLAYGVVNNVLGGFIVWWGKGLGAVTPILQAEGSLLSNLHSDVLKNVIEFGIPLSAIWLVLFFKFHGRSLLVMLMAIKLNILYLAENLFIYADVMFVFFLLVCFLQTEANERGAVETESRDGPAPDTPDPAVAPQEST